jgi:hypothetical protein
VIAIAGQLIRTVRGVALKLAEGWAGHVDLGRVRKHLDEHIDPLDARIAAAAEAARRSATSRLGVAALRMPCSGAVD